MAMVNLSSRDVCHILIGRARDAIATSAAGVHGLERWIRKSLPIFRNRVNPFPQKYSASFSPQITGITPPSRPMRGALANVTNARRDAVDADGVTDVRA
jgi:hypothetical protein